MSCLMIAVHPETSIMHMYSFTTLQLNLQSQSGALTSPSVAHAMRAQNKCHANSLHDYSRQRKTIHTLTVCISTKKNQRKKDCEPHLHI